MPNPPNILLLMTDQQRVDSLGCYGAAFTHTPNLDRCAREGALFDRCHVNNPICTPSRACLLTGKHIQDHGVRQLYDDLPNHEVLVTQLLRGLGYTTALFGKLHVSALETEVNRRHPNDGFDIYEPCIEGCVHMDAPYQAYARWLEARDPEFYARLKAEGRKLTHHQRELHFTHWAAERTIDFLRTRRPANAPFFCMMSIFDPHNPYEQYPKEVAEWVDPEAIPAPIPANPSHAEPADIARERTHGYLGDYATFAPDALRKIRHGYHAAVAFADHEFGRVLDTLAAEGLADNTLVIFTSDHGDMLGDHGLLVKGAYFYDANVRVPLLMRWPARIQPGTRAQCLVQLHDLAATILAAAAAPPELAEHTMPESANLLDVLDGRAQRAHDAVFCAYRNSGIARGGDYWDPPINASMIRDDRYKLNLWHAPAAPRQGELYDMRQDPDEQHNLWSNPGHAETQQNLLHRMRQWLQAHGETVELS